LHGKLQPRDCQLSPSDSKKQSEYVQPADLRLIRFYNSKLDRLLEFRPLAFATLDRIDESLIEQYIRQRHTRVAPATVNRELATLRRLLGLAYEWKLISRIPVIKKLAGERNREFVLNPQLERKYLELAPAPLNDAGVLLLDTGLRVGELVGLEKADIHLRPSNGAKFGFLFVRDGKSKNARRPISLTARAAAMLRLRLAGNDSKWVFPARKETIFWLRL
jgi:integrase